VHQESPGCRRCRATGVAEDPATPCGAREASARDTRANGGGRTAKASRSGIHDTYRQSTAAFDRRRRAARRKAATRRNEIALKQRMSTRARLAAKEQRQEQVSHSITLTVRPENEAATGAVCDVSRLLSHVHAHSVSPDDPHQHSSSIELAKIGAVEVAALDEDEARRALEEAAELEQFEADVDASLVESSAQSTGARDVHRTDQKLFLAFLFVLLIVLVALRCSSITKPSYRRSQSFKSSRSSGVSCKPLRSERSRIRGGRRCGARPTYSGGSPLSSSTRMHERTQQQG
jgi:hypothetical protein